MYYKCNIITDTNRESESMHISINSDLITFYIPTMPTETEGYGNSYRELAVSKKAMLHAIAAPVSDIAEYAMDTMLDIKRDSANSYTDKIKLGVRVLSDTIMLFISDHGEDGISNRIIELDKAQILHVLNTPEW